MSQSTPHSSTRRRWLQLTFAAVLTLLAALITGEALGWPLLASPIERLLSKKLDRAVSFSADTGSEPASPPFKIRFIGGLRLHAPKLQIAAPAWSTAPHLLVARELTLELRYLDLWRAWRGQQLRIERLQASVFDAELQRLADGRASWQFANPPAPVAEPLVIPVFGQLELGSGTLRYRDLLLATDIAAALTLTKADQPAVLLQLTATGHYQQLPLKVTLRSSTTAPSAASTVALPVLLNLNATIGRARVRFDGSVANALQFNDLSGHFKLEGPSLAAVGDLVSVTLPTTAAFSADGELMRQGDSWRVRLNNATVGGSRLSGNFIYATRGARPLLTGQLGGSRLLLKDLGPALGTASVDDEVPVVTRGKGMVLPDRRFNLPALRAMDAKVAIDIREVDLNTRFLEPLRPLRAQLQLSDGVLTLSALDARAAQGQLQGSLALDGRGAIALWKADLSWDGVRLERWIRQGREPGEAPLVSGQLKGQANLRGQGRSTAEILASLKGQVRTELRDGAVSHLLIEAAGIDLAQALGVLIKGGDTLPVQCAVADLAAEGGVFRPRVMVLDTSDTTIFIDGSLSLASEALNLRAVVSPKDFSPLTLRTPVRVRGTFADPELSLEKRPLGLKLAGAILLGLFNPLAALIPLIDTGSSANAKKGAAGCQGLSERLQPKPLAAAVRQRNN